MPAQQWLALNALTIDPLLVEATIPAAMSTINQVRLYSNQRGWERCQYDRDTRVVFYSLSGHRCGLLNVGNKAEGTELTFPMSYPVGDALKGEWWQLTDDNVVVPLPFKPTALVSNTGIRLQGSDLVGMWHDKLLPDVTGTVLSSAESDAD